ncbi:MAG TPA: HAMP domain-containing histidine kinase [Tenericutes bacterium]|nr:HAMP domain-containing histidine kinase [Mycoplasmatota bacterium]
MNLKELQKEKRIRTSLFKITHEIKNPIAVCKGYLDMFDIHNSDHSIKYIPIIKEEVNRTLTLLQDFLSLDNIKINKDILDINLLLDESLKSFNPLLKNNNITGCFDISDDEVFIYGDYNRLTQVVINIIQNSVESMKKDKISFIKIYTKVDDNFIKIYFEDNGCGMSKENLKKLEQPFFTTKAKGTGLGVYLSKEIIKAHDGTLRYKSKEDYGTTAILKLPLYSNKMKLEI